MDYIRDLTESGDYYAATKEKWQEYRDAVNNGNSEKVLYLEEGNDPDFYYDPAG